MKYLYCDSCFLITFYQNGKLEFLSQYKDRFFISETQIKDELIRPYDLPIVVRRSVIVIKEDRDEIISKTKELYSLYSNLSFYDCLCMAYALIDGYCLVTDDIALIKKCKKHNIEVKRFKDIEEEFIKEVVPMDN